MSATESDQPQNTAPANTKESGMTAKNPAKRRKTLLIVLLIFIVAGVAWLLLWLLVFSTRETTDDAYVGGNQVAISAQVPGTVVAILADDTQHVEAGQILVKLDNTDASVRLAQAQASLAAAVRQVRQQNDSASASDAGVAERQVELGKAEADLKRRLPLVAQQAEAPETIQHLRDAVAQARAALTTAQAQASAQHASIVGSDIANNPAVLQARANFRAMWVAAQRNAIYAPVSGYVAQRSVQVGNSVQAGQQLMTVLPLHNLWIDANFKESQLRHLRIGQAAKVQADIYGSSVEYHGKLIGMGAGTGSVFSLLPAQNATGNWIKVVQRVPVRIALDNNELDKHPLRIGLSSDVTVDITDDRGPVLAPQSERAPVAETTVYEQMASQADAEADKVIQANLGTSGHADRNRSN
jgi:membrane fusion protein (multidrug efflux system)